MLPTLALLVASVVTQQQATSPQADLRIVVVKGEDAVNIIQQKTAVAPLVEIRDRNNLPVAGATVTFTIGGNSAAFAGGAQTLTVVTNAAGQAAATSLSPVATGAMQIHVAAAFQGQTVAATIAQTNVMTAAEAASAASAAGGATSGAAGGGSGGAASGAAGGAAAGGGGLSTTTLVIAGAAVAGGAVAATQLADTVVGKKELAGNVSLDLTLVFSPDANGRSCTRVERYTGLLALEFDSLDAEPVNARATVENGRGEVISATTCATGPQTGQTSPWGMNPTQATGPKSNIAFTVTENFPPASNTFSFQGALNGETVTGTFRYAVRIDNGALGIVNGAGSTTVTLTRH